MAARTSGHKRRRQTGSARYGRPNEAEEDEVLGVDTQEQSPEDGDESEHDGLEKTVKGTQILPVAELAPDFDGEPEDGATFLALAK